jgi:hypothetical protein
MKPTYAFSISGLLAIALLTGASGNALATTRTHAAAFSCPIVIVPGIDFGTLSEPGAVNDLGQWYAPSGTNNALVLCPVNGTSATITGAWSNHADDIGIELCYQTVSGGGQVCGGYTYSTTGLQTLTPPAISGGIPAGAAVWFGVVIKQGSGSTFWAYTDNGA